jgi:hypothetical protein
MNATGPQTPPDLFDLVAEPVQQGSVTPAHRSPPLQLSFTRVGLYVVFSTAVGAVLRFPMPVFLLLPFAGVACAVASKSALIGACARVVFAAGVLAQATSIFVTPFSWWLRFTFFGVLIGAIVVASAWQIRDV